MSLFEQIKRGNDKAVVNELYKKVFPSIKSYIMKNGGSQDDVLDVFQEGMMLVYKKAFKDKIEMDNLEGYLYQTCVHKWMNHAKAAQRFNYIEDHSEFEKVTYSQEEVHSKKEPELINQLFSELGEKCKEILNLSIYSELSQEDIMHRMGFNSVGSVKMQYKRCKMKLLERIKGEPKLMELLRS